MDFAAPGTPSEPSSELWVVVAEETSDTWLSLHDPHGWHTAEMDYANGCVHYRKYANLPFTQSGHPQMVDYLHICDLDAEIARLQAIKQMAVAHFGEGWP